MLVSITISRRTTEFMAVTGLGLGLDDPQWIEAMDVDHAAVTLYRKTFARRPRADGARTVRLDQDELRALLELGIAMQASVEDQAPLDRPAIGIWNASVALIAKVEGALGAAEATDQTSTGPNDDEQSGRLLPRDPRR
ncbi:hypothetical protein D5S17_36085 [Pseudonocardiaceae bacterium YIM PH 21723]|nr:hypothetical protein D5S17_36085 [Pseudonocardiaceae bacterium YIM PH 21723]